MPSKSTQHRTPRFTRMSTLLTSRLQNQKHATVAHGKEEWVRGDVHTNTVESYWSLFNRALVGSFHQVSVKHLDRYLQESEYRFNARKERGLFDRTISRMCQTAKMEYKQLTAPVSE